LKACESRLFSFLRLNCAALSLARFTNPAVLLQHRAIKKPAHAGLFTPLVHRCQAMTALTPPPYL
ncbi:hypothetical protein ACMSZN_003769, partial [Cronobacter dublinensis]